MIFALKRDVVPVDAAQGIAPGNVQLRADKRPRPIVLRMNVGDCLRINFTNLLNFGPISDVENGVTSVDQPATRTASVHVMGMQLVGGSGRTARTWARTAAALCIPAAPRLTPSMPSIEGTYLLYSTAATTGGEGDGGSLSAGLFGAVNVEPAGAEWYRSQVTADDLALATKKNARGVAVKTPGAQPILDYNAVYPAGHPKAGLPILKMLSGGEIVHTDLNAIITGPNAWPLPDRHLQPYPVYP